MIFSRLYKIFQEITGPPYEEMDGKFYVDRNGSLKTITWKDDDDYIIYTFKYHVLHRWEDFSYN